MFSIEDIQIIKNLKSGNKIYIDDIRYLGPDDARKLPAFWIKIE